MFGKASLLMIVGFGLIFMIAGYNYSLYMIRAVDNMVDYHELTIVHNIAVSGANIAASNLFFNKSWTPGTTYQNVALGDGSFTITLTDTLVNKKIIRSTGSYNGVTKTITLMLQPSNFAKFGNFYNVFGAAAATGDTFSGHFHANDYCRVYGDPVFLGKTTCKSGLLKTYNPSNPTFLGGFESGVNIPLEFDTTGLRVSAMTNGKLFKGPSTKTFSDVDLTFLADGEVIYRYRYGSSSTTWDAWSAYDTVPLTTLAPNGVIFAEKGNITMKGVLNGQATVVATQKGSSAMGSVFLTDDMVYNSDPRTNPASTDMLGIIGEKKVEVTFDNSRGDINIHASIYAQKDGLSIASYSSYTGVSNMNLLGGIIAQQTKATATYSGGNPTNGYRFVHKFDERFLINVPPNFPNTRFFEVVSWLE